MYPPIEIGSACLLPPSILSNIIITFSLSCSFWDFMGQATLKAELTDFRRMHGKQHPNNI